MLASSKTAIAAGIRRPKSGLNSPSAGGLFLEGEAIEGPDPWRIVVFQDPTLYPWRTVWGNVALGLEARGLLRTHRERVEDALRLVGLSGFANAYPHQLSGGMSQRTALARALVNIRNCSFSTSLWASWIADAADHARRARFAVATGRLRRAIGDPRVEEALFLAGRVIVLSERPAQIKAEIVNSLPYPRHRGDPYLAELRHKVFAHLGLEANW